MAIELRRTVVFRMNRECPHAGNVGDLQSAAHGIEQQSRPKAPALHCRVNRETRQHQKANRVTRHSVGNARRRVNMLHLSGDERVKSDDLGAVQRGVGLR